MDALIVGGKADEGAARNSRAAPSTAALKDPEESRCTTRTRTSTGSEWPATTTEEVAEGSVRISHTEPMGPESTEESQRTRCARWSTVSVESETACDIDVCVAW